MDMPLIISALAFVLALTLLLGLAAYLHLMQFRQEWTARVEGRSATGWAGEIKERMGSFKTDVLGLMGQVGAATSTDEKAVSRLRRSLIMAGYRNAIAPYVFSAVRLHEAPVPVRHHHDVFGLGHDWVLSADAVVAYAHQGASAALDSRLSGRA
jgi:hypothetical protein